MLAKGKVTLKGSLSVTEKHCTCCESKDIMVVTVRNTSFNVCAACVERDCDCNGNEVAEVVK